MKVNVKNPNLVRAFTFGFGALALAVSVYLPVYNEAVRLFGTFLTGVGLLTITQLTEVK